MRAVTIAAPIEKRIAVFDFENATGTGAVSNTFFSMAGPNSDRTDLFTAAKVGRILGAITQNDFEDRATGIGGSSPSTKLDYKSRVEINARIVSSDTPEVLTVFEVFGEAIKKILSPTNDRTIAGVAAHDGRRGGAHVDFDALENVSFATSQEAENPKTGDLVKTSPKK